MSSQINFHKYLQKIGQIQNLYNFDIFWIDSSMWVATCSEKYPIQIICNCKHVTYGLSFMTLRLKNKLLCQVKTYWKLCCFRILVCALGWNSIFKETRFISVFTQISPSQPFRSQRHEKEAKAQKKDSVVWYMAQQGASTFFVSI